VLLELAAGNRDEAQVWYERASSAPETLESGIWLNLAEAHLARFDGDEQRAALALGQARRARIYDPAEGDYRAGADFFYYQYFYLVIPRQFLPQVDYPSDRVILLHLLDSA
jgi:hypothetical protein